MNAQYQSIAQEIVAVCPRPFREATLQATLGDGYSKMSLACVDDAGQRVTPELPTMVASNIDDTLVEVRENWPGEPWSSCTFTLLPNGEFKFDVSYDDAESPVGQP